MLMSLGLFAFSNDDLSYAQLQRRTSWRHPTNDRVGARAAGQYAGPGDDIVTMSGLLAPGVIGRAGALDDLRELADQGEAWPLVDGAGYVYGVFVITDLDETQRAIFADGVPRVSDFTLSLKRMDDSVAQDAA
ncbi:MAG: phage tail protein [Brevundimonas sp.]|nr:phage tail protein [Brevundimonas sp.]